MRYLQTIARMQKMRGSMTLFKHCFHEHQQRGARLSCFLGLSGKSEGARSADLAATNNDIETPKRLPNLSSLKGRARDEELMARIEQGASIIELASAFERTARFIAHEYDRLREGLSWESPAHFLRRVPPKRKGRWSGDEMGSLIELRNQGYLLKVISSWLRRTDKDVKRKLTKLEIDETIIPAGPQELSTNLRKTLFNDRLNDILCGLFERPMTSTWKDHISKKSLEEWNSLVSSGIADSVNRALGGLTAPS